MNLSTLDLVAFSGLADRSITINGGPGNDRIIGSSLADVLRGDGGDDDLRGRGGDDEIDGGSGADTLYGQGGADTIYGRVGDDLIFGGAGPDDLRGGAGSDQIHGEVGRDVLRGGEGADFLYGGDGNDRLSGGNDSDLMAGGLGDDGYVFANPDFTGLDTIDELANEGSDRVNVENLNLTAPLNPHSTEQQSLTAGQSLRFVTPGTVESILGNPQSASGDGIYEVPESDDEDEMTHVPFRLARMGRGGTLFSIHTGIYVYEVDAAGKAMNTDPSDPDTPIDGAWIDDNWGTQGGIEYHNVSKAFRGGSRFAMYIETAHGRFYSIPAMNDGVAHVTETTTEVGETLFSWELDAANNTGPDGSDLGSFNDFSIAIGLGPNLVYSEGFAYANPHDLIEGQATSYTFTFDRAHPFETGPVDLSHGVIVPWWPSYRAGINGALGVSYVPNDASFNRAVIPAGERSTTVKFDIFDNDYPGGDQSFGVVTGHAPDVTGLFPPFITIYDDDKVDLDVDSDNSGQVDDSLYEESIEEKFGEPGKIIAVAGARAQMILGRRNAGEIKLTVPLGVANKVRFWTSEYGGSAIEYLPEAEGGQAVLNPNLLQGTVWVEAIEPSNSPGDIVVTLQGPGGSEDTDSVRLTADGRVVVTIEEFDRDADEVMERAGVPRTGALHVVRTGKLDEPLLVNVSLGGTATYSALASDDYTLENVTSGWTGYFVEIPAGSSSTTIFVTPIQDGTDEDTETVIVTVQPYAGYELGAPTTQSGTVEILDAPNISGGSITYRIDIDARKDLYARAYDVGTDAQLLPPGGADTLWTGEPYLFSVIGLGDERTDGIAWKIEFIIESVSGGFDKDVLHGKGDGASFTADFDVVADEGKSPWRVRFFVDANRDGVKSVGEDEIRGNFADVEQNRKPLWVQQLKDEKQHHEGWIYDDVFGITDFFDELVSALDRVTFIRSVGGGANAQYYFIGDRLGVVDAENVPLGITTIIHESVHALDDFYNWDNYATPGPGQPIDAVEAVAYTAQGLLDRPGLLLQIRDFESFLNSDDAEASESQWRFVVIALDAFVTGRLVSVPVFGARPMTTDDIATTKNHVGLWFNMSGLMLQYQQRLDASAVRLQLATSVDVYGNTRSIPSVFLL